MLHLHQSHYRTSYNCEHENVYIFILALCAKATLIHTYVVFSLTKYSLWEVTACAWLHSAVCTKKYFICTGFSCIPFTYATTFTVIYRTLKFHSSHTRLETITEWQVEECTSYIYAKSYTHYTAAMLIDRHCQQL